MRCNELNGNSNLRSDENRRSIGTNIFGLIDVKSFVFVGGTQYHDGNDFCAKELMDTSYFNSLTFSLSGNNNKPVGEVFVELLMC